MPIVDIKVIEGVFSHDEKREALSGSRKPCLKRGGGGLRKSTHVLITETPSGEWAVGGRALTADDVNKKMRSSS